MYSHGHWEGHDSVTWTDKQTGIYLYKRQLLLIMIDIKDKTARSIEKGEV